MLRMAPKPLAENSQLLLRNTRTSESSLVDHLESMFRDTGFNFFQKGVRGVSLFIAISVIFYIPIVSHVLKWSACLATLTYHERRI